MSPLKWNSEGWGITHNYTHFFISDGSYKIYVTDEELNILETLRVVDQRGNTVQYLNELEWAQEGTTQFIYANVYFQNSIYKINLQGRVVELIDMSGVVTRELAKGGLQYGEVLNGIAISEGKMIATGKHWKLFFSSDLCD